MADPFYEQLKLAFLQQRWILIDKTDTARKSVGMLRAMLLMETSEQLKHPNYIFYFSYDRMVSLTLVQILTGR
jgi:hypothetical protein